MGKGKITWAIVFFTGVVLVGMSVQAKITAGDITGGAKAPHINIAIFHKLHGHDDFVYPEKLASTGILQSLAGKAQFISINHTSGLKDGDVLTISNDVLREGDTAFEDFGVDCQLSIRAKGHQVTLAGICEMLMVDQDHREIEHKGIIMPVAMSAGEGWELIYYDAEDGIAVYASEAFGLE